MSQATSQPSTAARENYGANDHYALIDEFARHVRASNRIAAEAIDKLYELNYALAVQLDAKAKENERISAHFLEKMRDEGSVNRRGFGHADAYAKSENEVAIEKELRELRRLVWRYLRIGRSFGEVAVMLWSGSALGALIWWLMLK